jgi:phosphoribosylformylglycinamidine (FGAM) synthase-like amidotransferase family enzyme
VITIVQFPGSNDDRDMRHAFKAVLGAEARLVWHKERELPVGTAAVVCPGGFSYGDYLRAGAMLGVCNGFQVLCEAGLLPGALVRNASLHFVCDFVPVRVERARGPFLSRARPGQRLRLPIKHGAGCYFAPPELMERLEAGGQVALRYEENPNGSLADVAGVLSERGNVLGLMPHPEHAVEAALGGEDGRVLLGSLLDALEGR